MIYLDHCATTPMSRPALEAYVQTAESFYGNEQSLHDHGDYARQLVRHCQAELASVINGEASGIFFTSGGSDSNISAILSLAYGNQARGKHIITSPLEHPSVYQALEKLKTEGFEVDEADVKPNGEVSVISLEEYIRDDTILVTICHASSETGVIQPLEDIGAVVTKHGICFHTDAVQTFAKIPIDVNKACLSALSMSAHKINGPKNTGACYIAPHVSWQSIYPRVVHQQGFKPGTLDTAGIAAFATAAFHMHQQQDQLYAKWRNMQHWLLEHINNDHAVLIGDKNKRLPHHLSLRLHGYEGQWVMLHCNRQGIAISAGSACKASYTDPPKSLLAMGLTAEEAHGLFRISFGIDTTDDDLNALAYTLNQCVPSVKPSL
ncbi:cysteine desulfurase [Alteribacillus persepolensis]|uniref:Cysteine desulfurase n=1 Tax=Alteribacillus persepolensis TaxID=568899 RepID=A0A1G8AY18_9BACI|nr:IscS subfamily cysteine desulfurase [Alteribacillus persepolensis]SDH25851.1 cysteine desulfurase [Alteribacillus persepolensis]